MEGAITAQRVRQAAQEQFEELVALRRYLHENAEPSMEEKTASALVRQEAQRLGLPWESVGEYGVVVTLKGRREGRCVCLRADMDALRLTESETNLSRRREVISKNPGVCHACGHDAHTAALLVAMRLLTRWRDKFDGTVLFLFESGEELPGSIPEVSAMLRDKKPDRLLALHVWNELESGKICVDAGPRMSGGGGLIYEIRGRGGHGSAPAAAVSPIRPAVQIASMFDEMRLTAVDPADVNVISVNLLQAGSASNIIPETARVGFSFRYYEPRYTLGIRERSARIVENVAAAYGCTSSLVQDLRLDPVYNDEGASALARGSVQKLFGKDCLVSAPAWAACESMGSYLSMVPGCLAFVGIRNEAVGSGGLHHNPLFDVDEGVLPACTALHIQVALDTLQSEGELT